MSDKQLKVFTWHVHGNYLLYLTQTNCEFYIPYTHERSSGYAGKTRNFPFGENVHEAYVTDIKDLDIDCIIFQDDDEYLKDQYSLFSEKQLHLPKIYIEHDPPRANPVTTKHIVDDPDMLIVHVTHFNRLMWDNNRTPTTVIEHGVMIPEGISYKGDFEKGIVMANNIGSEKRGLRRMGYDIFEQVRNAIPLEVIGMGSKEVGGLGEASYDHVATFLSSYRFFFNPIRYTSLGLSVCEAMMLGMPIIGIATTEMATLGENGKTGWVDTNVDRLISQMQLLLSDREKALEMSKQAKVYAEKRFSIQRFAKEWEETIKDFVTTSSH